MYYKNKQILLVYINWIWSVLRDVCVIKLNKKKTMDLLKTPSIQSLLDSDLESVESLHYIDFEEVNKKVRSLDLVYIFF